jgi:hypothetical protein
MALDFAAMTDREREIFDGLDPAAKSHEIVRDKAGVLRFKADPLLAWLSDAGRLDLNAVWQGLATGKYGPRDVMRLNRNIGYSIGGYDEVLGGHPEIWEAIGLDPQGGPP